MQIQPSSPGVYVIVPEVTHKYICVLLIVTGFICGNRESPGWYVFQTVPLKFQENVSKCITSLSPGDYAHNLYISIFQVLCIFTLPRDNEALSQLWLLELPSNKDSSSARLQNDAGHSRVNLTRFHMRFKKTVDNSSLCKRVLLWKTLLCSTLYYIEILSDKWVLVSNRLSRNIFLKRLIW